MKYLLPIPFKRKFLLSIFSLCIITIISFTTYSTIENAAVTGGGSGGGGCPAGSTYFYYNGSSCVLVSGCGTSSACCHVPGYGYTSPNTCSAPPPPTYGCQGNRCIQMSGGPYTSSTCNNSCAGSAGGNPPPGSNPVGATYQCNTATKSCSGVACTVDNKTCFSSLTSCTAACSSSSSTGNGTTGTCFPAGTKISMADGSQKNIENVKVGEKVIGYDESHNRNVVETVKQTQIKLSDNLYSIHFIDGTVLQVTSNHPLYTLQGWKSIDPDITRKETPELTVTKLEVGDAIRRENGSYDKITRMDYIPESILTYNLRDVADYNNFFADSFLAHNYTATAGKQTAPPTYYSCSFIAQSNKYACSSDVSCTSSGGNNYAGNTCFPTQASCNIACNLGMNVQVNPLNNDPNAGTFACGPKSEGTCWPDSCPTGTHSLSNDPTSGVCGNNPTFNTTHPGNYGVYPGHGLCCAPDPNTTTKTACEQSGNVCIPQSSNFDFPGQCAGGVAPFTGNGSQCQQGNICCPSPKNSTSIPSNLCSIINSKTVNGLGQTCGNAIGMDPDTLYSCNGNSNYGKVSTISCHGTGCSQCGAYYADVCGAASNCPHTSPGFINYVKNNLPPDPICQAIQKAGYSGDVCGAYLPSGIGADPNSLYNCDSGVLALPIACGIAGCKQSGKANSSDTCVNGTPSGQNNQITVTPSTVTINCDPTKHTCGTAAVTASSSVAVIIPSCIINPPHEVLTSNNQLMLTFQGNYQNEFPNFNPCQMRFIATGNPTLTITFNVTHTNNYSCNTTGNGFTGLTSGHSSGTCAAWAKCDTSKLAGDAVPCTHLPTCSNYSNWASLPGVSKIGHCEIPNFVGPVGNCQSGLGYSGSSDKQECGSTPGLGDNMCCNDTATDTGPVPPWVTTGTVLMASRVLSASTSAVPATTKPTQFPTILSFYPANLAESTKSNLLANVLAAQVYAAKDTLTYDPKTGYFVNPKFNTNTIPPGNYKVFVHVDKYLDAQLLQSDGSDTFNQQIGSPLSPKVANITPGDVAPAPHGDNIIDIQDYNAMVSCITGIACGNKSLYDLDNNGKVDNRDLDILISHFGESGASFGIPEFTCVTDPQCAKDSTKTIQLCPLKCTKITQNRGF